MRWGLIISSLIIIASLILSFGSITHYPGHSFFETQKAGFIDGLVHGIIAPIMLFVDILTNFKMYESNNSGFLYNLGFLIGLLIIWGTSTKGTTSIVKNYYQKSEQENSGRLHQDDLKEIGKIIDNKIEKKQKEITPKEELLKNKQNNTSNFKEEIVKKRVKIAKKN